MTFSSGASEAWVTDLIKNSKKDYLKDYFVKSRVFDSAALILSGFVGAFLVNYFGVKIIFPVTALSFFIPSILLIFAKEKYSRKKVRVRESLLEVKKQTKKTIKYSYKHPVISCFLLASGIILLAVEMGETIAGVPFLQSLGVQDHHFGYIWSGIAFMGVIAPMISQKFHVKGKERVFIALATLLMALPLLFIPIISNIMLGLSIIFLVAFFDFLRKPIERVYFHKFIPSNIRASVGSVESMFLAIVGIIAAPLGGLLVDSIGSKNTLFVTGVLLTFASFVFYKIKDIKK